MTSKILAVALVATLVVGGWFITTHHTETVEGSCHYSADAGGQMCDFEWVANS
jgi:hypothetical protein